jgi:hypothetical protein
MPNVGSSSSHPARLPYTYANFADAKVFLFEKWCQLAAERHLVRPADLSGACKYGSLFMQHVFGGAIRGHFEHQYNVIDGRLVDLSHDASDVGRMSNPYLHEPEYFDVPEFHAALAKCQPRANSWAVEFVLHQS